MTYKQIKVPEELHWELKKTAAKEKITIIKLLYKLLVSGRGGNKAKS